MLVSILPATSTAEDVVNKHFRFEERAGKLCVSGGFREMFGARLKKRLRSGFATTVTMRIYLYDSSGGDPLFASGATYRAVYDLWDESYRLQINDPRGMRTAATVSQQRVIDVLSSYWRFPLIEIDRIRRGRRYYVASYAEVNPMRPEVLAEVSRWLRRPPSRYRRSGGESFFGSFVSIFINRRIRRAEHVFLVRSQPFFRR